VVVAVVEGAGLQCKDGDGVFDPGVRCQGGLNARPSAGRGATRKRSPGPAQTGRILKPPAPLRSFVCLASLCLPRPPLPAASVMEVWRRQVRTVTVLLVTAGLSLHGGSRSSSLVQVNIKSLQESNFTNKCIVAKVSIIIIIIILVY
jgi:hypothetical protein